MAISCGSRYWRLGLASFVAMSYAIASSGNCAHAQVIPDETLGAEGSVVTPTNINGLPGEQIDGGATRGSNLFHSFEQFSIPIGGEAFFNNALDIQNIISRVTGESISNIDGLLRANGTANVFLLNPNGIIFGSNAQLSIGGSFVGSTASNLNFANGISFSATAPTTTPLLTVSVPIGLQFGGTTGSIVNQSRATNSIGQVVGLQVQQEKTLALIGGDVRLDGGVLTTQGGRVELGGVAGAGTVGLVDNNNLRLSFADGVARADVSLTNGSEVNIRSGGGGSIAVNARNLDVLGNSVLVAGIDEGLDSLDTQAGDITLNATEVIKVGQSSTIRNNINKNATGNSGNINITTGSLLTNDALLSASTFGQGSAGNVTINARDTISFDGVVVGSDLGGAISRSELGAVGNGGEISITTSSLSVTNGARIGTSTRGQGDAGNLSIATRSIVLDNGQLTVASLSAGKGGNIRLQVQDLLQMRHNSLIIAFDPRGTGNSGNIDINTGFLVAIPSEDSDVIASALRGGDIQIRAEGIFGIEYQEQRTPASDITATGEVELFTSDVDPSQGLVELPAELVDVSSQIASGCPASVREGESKFIIIGRGGLPPNPRQALSSNAVQVDWVDLDASRENRSNTKPANNPTIDSASTTIVEANGWEINDKGEVVLTATAPSATLNIPWVPKSNCTPEQKS